MTKFDLKLILSGPKNPNFDLAVRMGWSGSHCEDYQIIIPTIFHGSKSELEQPRYHENWDDALINAPLSFESHNFWFDCWIFKIYTFSKKGSQDLSRGLEVHAEAMNSLKHPSNLGGDTIFFFWISALCLVSIQVFLSSKHQKTPKK